ncbi:Ribosomal RNA small subunit methyltransferase G [bioreactor metagenome]|uniref:Ribosomal RNA small subunit methyltransferase G n=1 Tax=bioreactor metagenome TaxID=1076179 RepID=A0A644YHC3_9ZZZZ
MSEYCLPLVKVGGYFIAMKGSKFKEEISEGLTAVGILGGEIISAEEVKLPGLDDGRAIIRIRKIKKTPVKYPRKAGLPEKQPL